MNNNLLIANSIRTILAEQIKNTVKPSKLPKKSFHLPKFLKSTVYKNSAKDFDRFYKFDTNQFFRLLTEENPRVLETKGKEMAFSLFRQAAFKVPAYRKFLRANGINVRKIKRIDQFHSLPIITKKNYLTKYPLKDLSWDGKFQNLHLISVSSGLTGEPFFWPRGLGLEFETALEHELFMKYFFEVDKKKTLFIIGYAMGMYVAGVFTLNSLINLVKKGYPITMVSPGADKDSILRIVRNLGQTYDQVIIAAYSPVLKDLIDKGLEEGISWVDYNLKFISGGEGFSEEFRQYVYQKIGVDNYLKSSMNTYGSADAAILGHETPLSILIRKLANNNSKLRKALFKEDRVPSLHQYYPFFKYFEEVNGNLIFSTFGGIPLVRYSIGDIGGVISFENAMRILGDFNIDLKKEVKVYNCENLIWKLPFVYLFGRKDNTKIFYGANIYPEHIKNCLEQTEIINLVTGKYFMDILFDRNYNQSLYLAIELGPKKTPNPQLKKRIAKTIHHNLLNINDEYKYLSQTIGSMIYPTIEVFKYGDPKHFAPRIKPRYVKKP